MVLVGYGGSRHPTLLLSGQMQTLEPRCPCHGLTQVPVAPVQLLHASLPAKFTYSCANTQVSLQHHVSGPEPPCFPSGGHSYTCMSPPATELRGPNPAPFALIPVSPGAGSAICRTHSRAARPSPPRANPALRAGSAKPKAPRGHAAGFADNDVQAPPEALLGAFTSETPQCEFSSVSVKGRALAEISVHPPPPTPS